MSRKFRGEYTFKVDAKGRVSIPAPFRRLIERGDPEYTEGLRPQFVLVYGDETQDFLEGFTIKAARELEERIDMLPSSALKRELIKDYVTRSHDAEIDPDGRLVLPLKLREKIGLQQEAVLAGSFDTFKIWAPAKYKDFDKVKTDDLGFDVPKGTPKLDALAIVLAQMEEE